MSKVVELIEAAKAASGLSSDNALAKELEIDRSQISAYRKGSYNPEAYVVLRLAEMAGIDPAKAVAEVATEREKHPERRRWLENFRNAACWVGMAVATFLFSPVENTHAASMSYDKSTAGIQIIAVLNTVITSVRRALRHIYRGALAPRRFAGW